MAIKKPWFRRYFGWLIPEDPNEGMGYGPFKISTDHPFQRAGLLHDWEFGQSHSGTPDSSKDKTDWDFFWRMCLIARAEENMERRLELTWDIVKLWPIARIGGHLMWDGDPEKEN